MEQWALLILLNSSNICVWTELLLYLSFLPLLLLLLLSLLCTLDQCWAGIWFLLFFKLLPVPGTWKKIRIEELSVWVILKTFRIYPLVAHCLWCTKRSCKAPHGAAMVIWMNNVLKKNQELRKIWPFKVWGVKNTQIKSLNYTWKWMNNFLPTYDQTITCLPTDITYPTTNT